MPIAIVGMACRYPDASSPEELWENVLLKRRSFRRIPKERLSYDDYFCSDRTSPDHTYCFDAALIEGYEFDRLAYQISGSTFRSVDVAHWMALDVAAHALRDAGFDGGAGLPREVTGVLVGNTLTSEFSRSNQMRLRWPYVRRVVGGLLPRFGWDGERTADLLKAMEELYKMPFPPSDEETLAGSLSNTIAGRICNYFDLHGGGFSVDGACASSLLAVCQACSAIACGDWKVALAGGIDLSVDPFELVGFARVGALAPEEMRVYDATSAGFLPGEGCGFVVLMSLEDAQLEGRRIYAVVRGCGVASDGSGGITRPDVQGQIRALERAYKRAGFGVNTVAYFEGHGTGTPVGDRVELKALTQAIEKAGGPTTQAAIGSIKANIGHTKAAAGVAGVIKASLAIYHQIIPPIVGTVDPAPEFAAKNASLRVALSGEAWPEAQPLRAGVSAMGFGGINSHVALEGFTQSRRRALDQREKMMLASAQDAELILLGAKDASGLRRELEGLSNTASGLSTAELSDLAVYSEARLSEVDARAAIVATTPLDLLKGSQEILSALGSGKQRLFASKCFFDLGMHPVRIGFLFPGHGVCLPEDGGALERRFLSIQELNSKEGRATFGSDTALREVQPALGSLTLSGLRVLNELGVSGDVAVGHSLGEIVALHWAGAFDEETLLRILNARSAAFGANTLVKGTMVALSAQREKIEELLSNSSAVIAALNSPVQTVVAGEESSVNRLLKMAGRSGIRGRLLAVPFAFHSPLVAPVAPRFRESLGEERLNPLKRSVVSTVTGSFLDPGCDLISHLERQITSPVLFLNAIRMAEKKGVDLWIEVGTGQTLRSFISQITTTPAVSLNVGDKSLKGFLCAIGACFAVGVPARYHALYTDRFERPFRSDRGLVFLRNPCEMAPTLGPEWLSGSRERESQGARADTQAESCTPRIEIEVAPLLLVRELVAEKTELPLSAIKDSNRLLSDLHLNSITVGEIISEAARRRSLPPPLALTEYADASITEIAAALEELESRGSLAASKRDTDMAAGVDSWVRLFRPEWKAKSLVRFEPQHGEGSWVLIGCPEDPFFCSLQSLFSSEGAGAGAVVCLSEGFEDRHLSHLLEGSHSVLGRGESSRLVLVLRGRCPAGPALLRCLKQESPDTATCIVRVPADLPNAERLVLAEALSVKGHCEVDYDLFGVRREPFLKVLPTRKTEGTWLRSDDVLVVTGGGKGITAECALALAHKSGAALLLLGRSDPEVDEKLARNLNRFKEAAVRFLYRQVDVRSRGEVEAAIQEAETEFGPVTTVIHGAAVNRPALLAGLTKEMFTETMAPKIDGLRHLLASVRPEHLRLLVAFSSLASRIGLRGEAHYALANEWMTYMVEGWQEKHPHCRCLSIEWSVWSGLGMGEYMGKVDALVRQGITPISTEEGICLFESLVESQLEHVAVVVAGRMGNSPTLQMEKVDPPLRRFIERTQVFYPGIELVADADLSTDTDSYLNGHILDGDRILPAVIGLEAMAQAALSLAGSDSSLVVEDVHFSRPVVLNEEGQTIVRVAALAREAECIDVVLRSSRSDFVVDHFRATFRLRPDARRESGTAWPVRAHESSRLFGPNSDACGLYGEIFFQSERFRRVDGYDHLRASECVARLAGSSPDSWFSDYLPGVLDLGDPGARDAAIHAIQACVPYSRVVPVSVERIETRGLKIGEPHVMHARQRKQDGNMYQYDLSVYDSKGQLRESWIGLCLRQVSGISPLKGWPASLLGPLLERRLCGFLATPFRWAIVASLSKGACTQSETDQLIQMTLGRALTVYRRPDGKPVIGHGEHCSVSHADNVLLVITAPVPVGCDLEVVTHRSAANWRDLLGTDRFRLAEQIALQEHLDVSATRIWSLQESLKKAGTNLDVPLTLETDVFDGCVGVKAGRSVALSWAGVLRESGSLIVASVVIDASTSATTLPVTGENVRRAVGI